MAEMKKRITDAGAQECAAPGEGYRIYWCPATPGLGVRVTHGGFRSWIFERRVGGRTKRATLGAVSGSGRGAISAEAARALVIRRSGEWAQGRDVVAEERAAAKIEKVASVTFGDALRQYVGDDAARMNGKPLAARTKKDYLGMIAPEGIGSRGRHRKAGELFSIAAARLSKLTGPVIKELYLTLQKKRGPTRAAYAGRVVRAVLRYQGAKIESNPFHRDTVGRDRIRLPAPNARDRVIKPEELHAWWKAAGAASDGDKFMFMLLTGVRPGETSAITVADVDLAGGRIAIADPSRPYQVLLSAQAKRIAIERCSGKAPQDALFPGDARKSQAETIEESGVVFSPHDLRRTFETIAASLLPGYLAKKLVNHAAGGDVTAAHYFRPDDATLRAAWQTVADFVTKHAKTPVRKGTKTAAVLPFERAAAA